jgi:hypothetical protein
MACVSAKSPPTVAVVVVADPAPLPEGAELEMAAGTIAPAADVSAICVSITGNAFPSVHPR